MRDYILFSIVISTVLLALAKGTNGKVFTRCELSKALEKNKVNRSFISNCKNKLQIFDDDVAIHRRNLSGPIRVCLAESESGRNSSFVTKKVVYDMYGIFQIKNNEWCGRNGLVGGLCKTRCDNFIDDKLDDDIACAMRIFDKYGFKNWNGWLDKCKKQTLPNLRDC